MVKRYGLYARHIKPLFRKAMELMRKVKQLVFSFFSGRDTWRQRIIHRFQKDPLLCICGTEMELGFVWHPEYGVLYDIITDGPFDNEEKQEKEDQSNPPSEEIQLYLPMTQCGCSEDISRDVVVFFDIMDPGDPSVPPRFRCEKCGGFMLPNQSRA